MTGPPSFDVLGLGENSVDYVYRVPVYPQPDAASAKQRIAASRVSPGGQVATTLCTCAALGLRVRYLGVFGSDADGERVRRALAERGVDTSAAALCRARNRYAVILVGAEGGERVVLWERDPRLAEVAASLDLRAVLDARLLHVDAVDAPLAIRAARLAREAGIPVTSDIDEVSAETPALLAAVTVPMLSEHALEALTGAGDPEGGLRRLRRQHSGPLCVTLGARGAMMLVGDRLHHHPGYRVAAVDTTSAGDVFRGAFIDGLLRGEPPERLLRRANAAAALACTREGAIDAVPSRAEVDALLHAGA